MRKPSRRHAAYRLFPSPPLLLLLFLCCCLPLPLPPAAAAAAAAAPCSAADDGHITVAADAAGGVSLPLPLDVSEADWTLCAFFMHEVHTAADAQTVLAVGAAAGLANDRQLLQLAFASFTEPGFSDWHAPLRLTAADPSTPPFIDLNGVTPLRSVRRWQQFCIRVRSAAVHGAGQGRVQLHAPGIDFTDDEARFVDFQGTNDLYLGSLPDGSQAMPIRFDGLQPAQLLFVFPALAFSHSPFLRTFPHASCFSFCMPVFSLCRLLYVCVCFAFLFAFVLEPLRAARVEPHPGNRRDHHRICHRGVLVHGPSRAVLSFRRLIHRI